MCERKSNGDNQTVKLRLHGELVDIDKCIAPFIKILNDNNVNTEFSCCGHGNDHPDFHLKSADDFVRFANLLAKWNSLVKNKDYEWYFEWIHRIDHNWRIEMDAIICTPPRWPSWIDSKATIRIQNKLRKQIGLP